MPPELPDDSWIETTDPFNHISIWDDDSRLRTSGIFTYRILHRTEKMAAIVSYSPYHFSRTFHSLTGRTPMEYLKDVRIQKAVQLLKAGSSVGEAARSCGFNSPNYFCKVFREALGYPPSHYRPK